MMQDPDLTRFAEVLPDDDDETDLPDASHFEDKVAKQRHILDSQRDLTAFTKAARVFPKLQHIQILRTLDREDSALAALLRDNDEASHFVELSWPRACEHGTKVIGRALVISGSSCARFSCPMASAEGAASLERQHVDPSFQVLAVNLTSLELHFDENFDTDLRIQGLSTFFRRLFHSTANLQSIHLGFPAHRPLSLPLDDVFHQIYWPQLTAFGIQAWKLDTEEIVDFTQRHRQKLRGLRLRDVLLREGSRWKEVLVHLRDNMSQLGWVR